MPRREIEALSGIDDALAKYGDARSELEIEREALAKAKDARERSLLRKAFEFRRLPVFFKAALDLMHERRREQPDVMMRYDAIASELENGRFAKSGPARYMVLAAYRRSILGRRRVTQGPPRRRRYRHAKVTMADLDAAREIVGHDPRRDDGVADVLSRVLHDRALQELPLLTRVREAAGGVDVAKIVHAVCRVIIAVFAARIAR